MTFDPFNQTVAAFIALFISGVLPAAVAYVINYLFPALSGTFKNFLQGGLVFVFTAIITALAHQIPQTWLDKTVFDALVALISLFFGWAGSIFGSYYGKYIAVGNVRIKSVISDFKIKGGRIIGAFVLAIVLLGSLTPLAAMAAQPAPELVMAEMFAKHPDFPTPAAPCQAVFLSGAKFVGVREPFMDVFAASRGLDADKVQCYWWTWLFDRDVNATNPAKELGSGVAKGHYAVRGINNFDRAELHWRDLNEVAYELGGQPLFRYINDATDRPRHQWVIGNGMIAE